MKVMKPKQNLLIKLIRLDNKGRLKRCKQKKLQRKGLKKIKEMMKV